MCNEVKYPENYLTIFHKQIDLLQDNIKRMNNNSFLIKAWTIGLLALSISFIKDFEAKSVLLLMIPVLFLWFIDGCFMYYESKFRDKYNELIDFNNENIKGEKFDVVKLGTFYNMELPKESNFDDEIIEKMESKILMAFYGFHVFFILLIFILKEYLHV